MKSIYMDLLKLSGTTFRKEYRHLWQWAAFEEVSIDTKKEISMPCHDFSYAAVPVRPDTTEDSDALFRKVYSFFSGQDIIVMANGRVLGEIQAITFAKMEDHMARFMKESKEYADAPMLETHPVAVHLEQAIFNQLVHIESGTDLVLCFANEYGNTAFMAVHGLVELMSGGGFSMEEPVSNRNIICAAVSLTPMQPLQLVQKSKTSLEDLSAQPIWDSPKTQELRKAVSAVKGQKNTLTNRCLLESIFHAI